VDKGLSKLFLQATKKLTIKLLTSVWPMNRFPGKTFWKRALAPHGINKRKIRALREVKAMKKATYERPKESTPPGGR
jgi:hypothetical protein